MTQSIRKAFWPAAIAIGFVLFLGAVGNTRPAYALVEDGAWFADEYGVPDDGDGLTLACEDGENLIDLFVYNPDDDVDESEKGWSEEDHLPALDADDEDLLIAQMFVDESVILCVNPVEGDDSVTFDSDDYGEFSDAACGDNGDNAGADGDEDVGPTPDGTHAGDDDDCLDPSGNDTDHLVIDDVTEAGAENDLDIIMVTFTCEDTVGVAHITIEQNDGQDDVEFWIQCKDDPDVVTVTAEPLTIEVVPAAGNSAHSLIRVVITAKGSAPPPDTEVQFSVNQCAIEEAGVDTLEERAEARGTGSSTGGLVGGLPGSAGAWHTFANLQAPDTSPLSDVFTPDSSSTEGVLEIDGSDDDDFPEQGEALAIVHADLGGFGHSGSCAPGKITVTVIVQVDEGSDITRTVEITVIGPPASITVAASPSTVRCGEKSTITATIKDSLGQNVSDHTQVEMVTNLGGVLGGTGAVLSSAGAGVVPISSTVAETFAGVATAFLLTSDSHGGPYEVVVTTGGNSNWLFSSGQTTLGSGGLFSTAPISAQVTINCAAPVVAPAATISAPRTGTGSIVPPNTGDGGLADSSGSSWALFAIGGAAAFTLAGLASLKFARR